MGLRVLATLVITFVGIRLSFINAFYGLITYAFWSYTYPERATWGFLPLSSLSYFTGLTVVATTIMQKRKLFNNNPANTAILVFWFLCLVSIIASGATDESLYQFKYFTRVILITLIITLLVDDLKRFKIYLWAIVICVGAVAARSGIIGILTGFIGGAKSGYAGVLEDRNFTAVILCAMVPIIFYMAQTQRKKWVKLFLFGIFIGDIFAIQITYARAGFIGLVAIGAFIIMKSKHKVLAGLLTVLLVFIGMKVVPEEYISRILTIQKFDASKKDVDLSAAGRVLFWKAAIEMIKDLPMTGVGFYNSKAAIGGYADRVATNTGIDITGKSIHNTFLQVASDNGLPAVFLYIGMFFTAYLRLTRIKKKIAWGIIENKEVGGYASMLQAAFVGFFSCAFFVSAAYMDISWHLMGLTLALESIANKEIPIKQIT